MSAPVQIPADVDREDQILGSLTARQLAITTVAATVVFGVWQLTGPARLLVFAIAVVPVAVLGIALVVGRRDGVPFDRLLLAALGQRLALPGAPRGLRTPGVGRVVAARLPVGRVLAVGSDRLGVVDLDGDGWAAVCAVTPINLSLRSGAEQDAVIGGFARWLHSLSGPVQLLTRSRPLDLNTPIEHLHQHAHTLPTRELAGAALAHADHLHDLDSRAELLHREMLIVFRDPAPARGARAAAAAGQRLRRRTEEAVALLTPLGLRVTPLPDADTATVLRRATAPATTLDPEHPTPVPRPDAVSAGSADDDPPTVELPAVSPEARAGGGVLPGRGLVRRRRRAAATGGRSRASRWFAPGRVRVAARQVVLDGVCATTLVVTGFPREVPGGGWLAPITGHPGLVDVSVHVTPLDTTIAAGRLRRRLARLEAARRSGTVHGRLPDPDVDAAAEDAHLLAERVARGEARLFTTTITVTVTATTPAGLDGEVAAVRALLSSMLITAHPATWRAWHGWLTGLPLGLDRVGTGRVLDTASLAAAFPFASPDLPPPTSPTTVLYGQNLVSSSLVFWDRWACDNYNSVILGRSGAGKSYLVKLDLLRSLQTGVHAQVVDPEDEYRRLADAVGATTVRLGAPGVRINPLDLDTHTLPDGTRTAAPDALARRRLTLHTLLTIALTTTDHSTDDRSSAGGELSASERAVLDEAITMTYVRAGITDDPATWTRPAPLLADLHHTLTTHGQDRIAPGAIDRALHPDTAVEDDDLDIDAGNDAAVDLAAGSAVRNVHTATDGIAADLAARLRPFVDGAFSGLFDGPTSHPPTAGPLTVWSVREVPEPLRPLATMLVLDAIWRTVTHPHDRRRRLVVVDEAWLLLQHRAGARFLLRAAKSGRKHWCGLTVATQDTADILGSDLGRAVITNAATQILLRQAPQAIDRVTDVFGLSAGERGFLLSAQRGDGLLTGGEQRAAFTALASDQEDALITTDPTHLTTHSTAPAWVRLDPEPAHAGVHPGVHGEDAW
ncbi:TraG/VirB4 family ATPase [Pseudonocardia alni]|uniref:TraG/VirB4 family ATPase n=1 Tax=Pseudonocardia alni TaxID=33907 RepID=UPI0033EC50E4